MIVVIIRASSNFTVLLSDRQLVLRRWRRVEERLECETLIWGSLSGRL